MKISVLGCTGLLGNQVLSVLSKEFDTTGFCRNLPNIFWNEVKTEIGFDVFKCDFESFKNYDVIINCVGIVPRMSKGVINDFYINSIFPQKLNRYCIDNSKYLIHISTDCVFDGRKGNCSIYDKPNARDIYGISKYMGETQDNLTIRTSIIGHEFRNKTGLLEWFLNQNVPIRGYTNAFWNGVTAKELSKCIINILDKKPRGLLHISGEKLSKYELLSKIKSVYKKDVEIIPENNFVTDKTLTPTPLDIFNIKLNNIDKMIEEMKNAWCF